MNLAISSACPASEIGALAHRAAPRGLLAAAEDGFLSAVFAALVVLPLAEIALRATLGVGIQGAASLTQHFTLLVGMLGAAVAARQGRLLGFSASVFLRGDRAQYAKIFAFACATATTVNEPANNECKREPGDPWLPSPPMWRTLHWWLFRRSSTVFVTRLIHRR